MTTLELRDITKRYPRVLANDAVSLSVGAGEVHALIGENGAGKSTLMSILYGLVQPDAGEIVVNGEARRFASSRDAIDAGIGMVFQSFRLFPELTVAENVVFGAEPHRYRVISRARAARHVTEVAERHGLGLPVDALVRDLPVGVLQRVEIVKALYRHASVLILDEPTGVLTPQEGKALFTVLRALAAAGTSVIFISHKLDEVMSVADRVTVLRDGRVISTRDVADTTALEISREMTGRNVAGSPRTAAPRGAAVLEVSDATLMEGERRALDDVSLTVHAGEIVGVAGVAGNGQELLAASIAGHLPLSAGTVVLGGHDLTAASNADRRHHGLSHVPEDRNTSGSATDADAVLNLAAGAHRSAPLLRHGLLRPRELRRHARELIDRFGVKIASPETRVGTLSGGNLQKLVVARELGRDSAFLLAEQPTRGVDVGAIEAIHAELDAYRARGGAVLLISSELTELLELSDRIVVLFDGRAIAELDVAEADEERLGLLMAGVVPRAVAA